MANSPGFCGWQKGMVTSAAGSAGESLFTDTLCSVLLKIHFIRIATAFQRRSCQNQLSGVRCVQCYLCLCGHPWHLLLQVKLSVFLSSAVRLERMVYVEQIPYLHQVVGF